MVGRVGDVVHAVRVVPHNAKILSGGLEPRKAPDCFVGICDSLGVGVFRHTPDALDCAVAFRKPFNNVHIGPLRRHRNVYHLDAEIFCNTEMPVIAGNRTKELHLFLPAPRLAAAGCRPSSCRKSYRTSY